MLCNRLAVVFPGGFSGLSTDPHFTNVNGTLFFTAFTSETGLWKSDGTEAGTVMVKNLFRGVPGFAGVIDTTPMSLTAFNGKLLFNGFNGVNGNELWISDGTAAGTVLVKDIYPGLLGSIYPGDAQLSDVIIALRRSAVLAASDGFTGLELWKTNGEGVGTILVQDILLGPGSSTPQQFVQSANQVFFTAFDLSNRYGLWVAPLAALDVSLEEQIDQLLLLLNAPEIQNLKLPESLNSQLTNARGEVSSDNAPGQFVAARSHLGNFIKDLQNLLEKGIITASQAQPLLDGAKAILEQIEGNHPPKHGSDENE